MKKVNFKPLFALIICSAIVLFSNSVQAQYKTAAGLHIDAGDGTTLVGPHIKTFFSPNSAGEAGVLFGGGLTAIQAQYQYHQGISGAEGLQWYLGAGPSFLFSDGSDTEVSLVTALGLDYKIANAPLDLSFDWRPRLVFYDGDSEFLPGRFGIGLRFVFR